MKMISWDSIQVRYGKNQNQSITKLNIIVDVCPTLIKETERGLFESPSCLLSYTRGKLIVLRNLISELQSRDDGSQLSPSLKNKWFFQHSAENKTFPMCLEPHFRKVVLHNLSPVPLKPGKKSLYIFRVVFLRRSRRKGRRRQLEWSNEITQWMTQITLVNTWNLWQCRTQL